MRRVEFLCHDINVHVPHHVNSKIPWYNLRSATDSLRQNWGQVGTHVSSMDTPVTFLFLSAFAHAVGVITFLFLSAFAHATGDYASTL
jgi:fatty acid desaturase